MRAERIRAKDAALILGEPVRTVQAMAAQGMIPSAAKIFGSRWTFDEKRLREWVEQGRPQRPPHEHFPDEEVDIGPSTGQVYILQVRNFVKIGWSRNVSARLRTLKNGTPHPITLLAVIDGDMRLELSLHERFARQRSHGEWFRRTGAVARWIEMGFGL